MRAGSTNELSGGFGVDTVTVVSDAPGIKQRCGKNKPQCISPELYVLVDGKMTRQGREHQSAAARREPDGAAGAQELQARRRTHVPRRHQRSHRRRRRRQAYDGLEVGKTVRWGNANWNVVGRFTDDGGIAESEAWGDTRVVQQAWRRGNSFQSIRVKLEQSGSAQDAQGCADQGSARARRTCKSERAFYADQQKLMSTIINTVGWTLAIMMGVAALFAALNTLYNAVATRVREIATLRAMGFGGWPVMISVLVEAMILGAVGGLIGGLLAFLYLNGMHSSTMNWASFSQMTFAFTVTPQLMITGIIYGLILTFIAGILPGIRAARLPITAGLREL